MRTKIYNFFVKIKKIVFNFLISKFENSNKSNETLLSEHLNFTYGDQKGQVEFLINNVLDYEKNGLMKGGFFVDLACADGVNINNTYFLEKYLEWDGILFEPNPEYKNIIQKFRKTKLVSDCVTDRLGDKVKFRIDNGMLGGIVSEETDNSENVRGNELKSAKILELNTTTLDNELDKISAPSLIDFLSLDVEGAEWMVLKAFPFNKYKFRCMTIERPNIKLDLLLEKNGYRQVAHLKYDVIYVHRDFQNEVNFKPNIRFSFTPKKDW